MHARVHEASDISFRAFKRLVRVWDLWDRRLTSFARAKKAGAKVLVVTADSRRTKLPIMPSRRAWHRHRLRPIARSCRLRAASRCRERRSTRIDLEICEVWNRQCARASLLETAPPTFSKFPITRRPRKTRRCVSACRILLRYNWSNRSTRRAARVSRSLLWIATARKIPINRCLNPDASLQKFLTALSGRHDRKTSPALIRLCMSEILRKKFP